MARPSESMGEVYALARSVLLFSVQDGTMLSPQESAEFAFDFAEAFVEEAAKRAARKEAGDGEGPQE